jgi:zinc protease
MKKIALSQSNWLSIVNIFGFLIVLFLSLSISSVQAQTKAPSVHIEALVNGMRLMLVEQRQLPIIYMQLMLRGGSRFDPVGKEGIAEFTARMLERGTKNRTGKQIAEEIDFIGGQLATWSELERSYVSVRTLKKDFQTAIRLLSDLVLNANFPEEEMAVVRNELVAEVASVQDDPTELLNEHLRYALYGNQHELGQVMTRDSIKAITRDDLVDFYAKVYRPNATILIIAGDFDKSEIIAEAKLDLVHWPSENEAVDQTRAARQGWDPARVPNGYEVRFVHKSGQTQTQIGFAHSGIAFKDNDYLPAQLANYVLGGGGFSSRLLKVIRSEQGKTYDISSRFTPYRYSGMFQVNTFTRNEEVFNTMELIVRELISFRESGITEDELIKAKGALAGRHVLRFETLRGLTQAILDREFYERGKHWLSDFPTQVRSVTLEQVNAAISRRFTPENMVIAMLGDRKIFENHETLFGSVPTSEISIVNWSDAITAQGKPLRLLTQPTASANCPARQICASVDEQTKPIVLAWAVAHGGLEAMNIVKDSQSHWVGQTRLNNLLTNTTMTQALLGPDKYSLTYEFKRNSGALVFSQIAKGEEGWFHFQNRTNDLTATELYSLGRELYFYQSELLPRILNNPGYKLSLVGTEKVENTQTDVIDVRSPTSHSYKFYLDQTTHRLVRIDLVAEKQSYYFSEYKQIGNLWPAHKMRIFIEGELDTDVTLQKLTYNQGLDAKLFERPQ